ncbi:hypothetical protein PI126_g14774 [Phytophthora idaei]|nr:hypothetical protein PI126_g14774 [Phytophthora idaei]
MLESMAHWHQVDETPWVRSVPKRYLDLVIAELQKRGDPASTMASTSDCGSDFAGLFVTSPGRAEGQRRQERVHVRLLFFL